MRSMSHFGKPSPSSRRRTVAVVGSGIAGLATAWMLSRHHDVTLFEREPRAGGHANTIDGMADGTRVPMDTGFMVYNERNYPLLTRLFRHLDVATQPTEMSFSVSVDEGRYEWAGTNLNTLFAQRRNLFARQHWRMLLDIVRFNRAAYHLLDQAPDEALSLGAFLSREGLSETLANDYLLPMAAAIWSCPTSTMRDFPALSLCRFFRNHGLIDLFGRPPWRTVVGGSRTYVERLLLQAPLRQQLGDPVHRVRANANGWTIDTDEDSLNADQVVLACHADEALGLLEGAPEATRAVLSAFRYQPNDTWVHSDPALMPKRRSVWSSWNYLANDSDGTRDVSVTYWLNRLQNLPGNRNWFVSLNPPRPPQEDTVLRRLNYSHPVFDAAAMAAQKELPGVQGMRGLWLAGAYAGYGFHEDGLASAVAIARRWNCLPDWLDLEAASPSEPTPTAHLAEVG